MLVERRAAGRRTGRALRYDGPRRLRDDSPVLLYVGRFTEVKRIPLLIEAYERARPGFSRRAPLVIVGGFPGEWEGEHPHDAIRRTARSDVYLAGWHDHDELPDILAACRRARPAVGARAVRPGDRRGDGLRAAARSPSTPTGPRTSSTTARPAGWSSPTTSQALANALVEAVNRPAERRRRGANAAAASRTSATPGRRSPSGSPRSTTTRVDATIVARRTPH